MHTRGIEVGQIFYFGTKYSEPMQALITGPDGVERPIHGGSYGVGVSRLVGALIEACHDENGIIWPEAVAPFKVAILNLKQGDADDRRRLRAALRELSPRASTCSTTTPTSAPAPNSPPLDLIGLPWQIIVGPKGLADGKVELKRRADGSRENVALAEAVARLTQ